LCRRRNPYSSWHSQKSLFSPDISRTARPFIGLTFTTRSVYLVLEDGKSPPLLFLNQIEYLDLFADWKGFRSFCQLSLSSLDPQLTHSPPPPPAVLLSAGQLEGQIRCCPRFQYLDISKVLSHNSLKAPIWLPSTAIHFCGASSIARSATDQVPWECVDF
jgi:hypothetical protein